MAEHKREVRFTEKEMDDLHIAHAWRDNCVHLLVPLNNCRRENYYLPWRCSHERHAYDKCQYEEYLERMKEAKRQKAIKSLADAKQS